MAKTRIQIRREAVNARVRGLELAKQRYVAFHWSVDKLEKNTYLEQEVKNAIRVVSRALVKKELDAYRDMFMMAIILPDDLLEQTKKEIMTRFIADGKSIMYLLNADCEMPNIFPGADRDTFRELLMESLEENNTE